LFKSGIILCPFDLIGTEYYDDEYDDAAIQNGIINRDARTISWYISWPEFPGYDYDYSADLDTDWNMVNGVYDQIAGDGNDDGTFAADRE